MLFINTTESALDLLWDIAIALLIVRLAFIYTVLTFLTGCVLGYIRLKMVIPKYHLSQPIAELLEMPLMLLAVFIWARLVVVRFSVPNVAGMRLAIGFVALGYMLIAELGGRFLLSENGFRTRISGMDMIADGAFAACLLLFALMPWLLMEFEKQKEVRAQEVIPQRKEL